MLLNRFYAALLTSSGVGKGVTISPSATVAAPGIRPILTYKRECVKIQNLDTLLPFYCEIAS